MHAAMLADLAATVGLHGPRLFSMTDPIPAAALQQYWIASRKRAARWHQTLGMYRQYELAGDMVGMMSWWETHQSTMEEILVSEILTRVYAAIGYGVDSGAAEPEVSPVVQSVHIAHFEARNRVLGLMIGGRGAGADATARLNRLRKTVERWTDVLVGQIAAKYPDAARYGTVLERTLSFADEASDHEPATRQTHGWLLAATMRDSLARQMTDHTANPEENREVCEAVLVSLRPDMFDSLGSLESLWLHRLRCGTEETDNVLDQLKHYDIDQADLLPGFEAIRKPSFTSRLRRN